MTKNEFNSEVNYQMAMHYAQRLLKDGVITANEMKKFERETQDRYRPIYGKIFLSLA